MNYRSFPPGRGHLKIPLDSKRSVRAGLAMYPPCRSRGRFARALSWHLVGVFGARTLPGRRDDWHPPMGDEIWAHLIDAWTGLGLSFNGFVVHERLQKSRSGFALLLLHSGDPVAFVKLREGDRAPIERELRALEAMSTFRPTMFVVPKPLGTGSIAGWHYLAATAFPPELHTVPRAPRLGEIADEISRGLRPLDRPIDMPSDWSPMHGDFTPWNLRQRRDGTLFLVDWEDAGWGPAGADVALYRAVTSLLTGAQLVGVSHEAREFWADRVRSRQGSRTDDADAAVDVKLLALLRG